MFTVPPGTFVVTSASAAVCTANVVLLVTPARLAEMVVVPAETAVARPPLAMVATDVRVEPQFTWLVIFAVVPLEYVPVAVNGCEVPVTRVAFVGVTAIEIRVGAGPALPAA